MSLIRLIQEAGTIPTGPIFSLKAFDSDFDNTKQLLKEKDVIIHNNKETIRQLENYVAELKEHSTVLEDELKTASDKYTKDYSQMPSIIKNYERFISNMTADYETLKEERNIAGVHLANLEMAFADLLEKYERLKTIICGYQQNQDVLLEQTEIYNETIKILNKKYDNFKNYANEKLTEANIHVEQNDKKHISELAKVKSKVLQSKVRISELEKAISIMSLKENGGDVTADTNNKSMFAPLPTYFSHH